jgi:hypothetical protein
LVDTGMAPFQTFHEAVTGAKLPNPVGRGLADSAAEGAGVAEQARIESKEAQAGTAAPSSLAAAFGDPGNTLRYYGGLIAESAPMMAAAMATRNPAVATAAMGVGTAGQTYGTERAEGASPQEAFDRAGVSGFMESGLGLGPFEKALGAGSLGRRMVKAGLSEARTEGVTGVGQLVATDAMKGKDTSRADINRAGIDSTIVGGGIGAGMAVLGSGRPDQKAKTANEQTQDAIQQARGRQDFRDFERDLNDSLTPTARPAPRTPAEAGSQSAEDALAQARARTAEPPPAPGKPLNPLPDADAIRAQQGQPPLPETLTRRGRDEKYGVDVEMTPDGKGGYLHVETDASGRREEKIEGTLSGIYQGKLVLNEEGEFVSTNTINRAAHEKDTAKRVFQPPTKEQRQAVVDLVAEIAFERSIGNMARVESLESTLADIAMGRVAATPAPVAAPPLGDIPAESTTDLDAAIDAMLAPTTDTAPDGRLGTSAPIAAPPVVGSGGIVDAATPTPDSVASAVGDAAPETGRRPFLTPDDVAREKFTARATEAGLSPEQIAQMTPDTLADDVTGFFDGRLKGVKSGTILRAQEHVKATGEPAFYVNGDIVNLGGLNKATGENMEVANAHYRAMTDILRAELESTGGDIVPLRTGGDEVGAVVVNAPESAIRAAMTAANAKVRAYAQANGFGDIPHTKADRTDRGVGLHLGLAPIQPGASLSDIIEASSAEIAASKGGTPDVNGSQTERLGPVAPVGPAGSVGGSVATEAQGIVGQDAARLGPAPSTQGDAQGVRAAPQVIPAEAPSAPTVTAPPPSARPAPKGRSTLRAIAKTIGLDLADFKRHGVDPANFRGSKGSMPGLFRKQGGMTLSRFREWAQENEYLPRDPENAPPTVSDDDALDLFYRLFANEEAVALGDADANVQAKAEQERKRAEDRLNADPAAAMQRQRARDIGNERALEALADFDNGLLTAPGLQKRLDDAETYDESAVPFSRAPANQPGLLDDATPQERVESERQRRDDQRNGKAGSGRTDMASGDGELFAGNRPDQSSLFSRTDKPQGIALNTLSRVVRSLFSGWTNAPTVRAVQSVSDVPADVRERARLQTVFHGSPHRGIESEGFKLNAIGTGEGAQAYGYGLYFAGKRDVAEWYREKLSGKSVSLDVLERYFAPGRIIRSKFSNVGDDEVVQFQRSADGWAWSVQVRERRRDGSFNPPRWHSTQPDIADIEAALGPLPAGGQLYSANVPEDSVLLDYDKTLIEQSDAVIRALEAIGLVQNMAKQKELLAKSDDLLLRQLDATGQEQSALLDEWRKSSDELGRVRGNGLGPSAKGRDVYTALTMRNDGNEKAASESLLAAGIPGLRYRDGTSRHKDEGTHNYVIWDEGAIGDVQAHYSRESEGEAEGFFDPQTETVWLIADALSTPSRARWVAYHEVTGHYGIRGVVDRIGKGAGSLRKAFAATRSNPTIDKLARAIAFDRGLSDAEQNVATEEALAELSAAEETGDWQHLADRYNVTVPASMRQGIRGAIDRFVQSIKRLFSIITEGRTDAFTDADWRELVRGAGRYVRKKPESKAEPEPENFDVDLEFDVDVDGETVKATGNAQRMLDLAQKRIDNLTRLAECIAA